MKIDHQRTRLGCDITGTCAGEIPQLRARGGGAVIHVEVVETAFRIIGARKVDLTTRGLGVDDQIAVQAIGVSAGESRKDFYGRPRFVRATR